MENLIPVSLFFRKPFAGNYSIESLFENIYVAFPETIVCQKIDMLYYSKGLLPRIRNTLFARRNQSAVNHITGDIHYIALLLKKQKTILTIHDLEFLKRQKKGIRYFLLWVFWVYLPVHRVKTITVISEATKRDLLRYVQIPSEKIVVIPNCISSALKYSPKEEPNKEFTILHVGTKRNKNLPNLLKAIQNLPCRLIIIGRLTGEHQALLLELQIHYENRFDLSYPEIIEVYQQCDMLSFVSTLEGFGLPILEAQAIGRPILTSNVSSMPEVAGDGALLVDPMNIEDIRNGICKIRTDSELRIQLVKKGLQNVKKYSAQSVARQYGELYRKVLSTE